MSVRRPRVLLAVHTFAVWGGLQDWAVGMAKGLASLGVDVGLVTNNERMKDLAAESADQIFLVEWASWYEAVPLIMENGPWDVVFSQPFGARELGVYFKQIHNIPLVVMCHGNNSDGVHGWGPLADRVVLASESLEATMGAFGKVYQDRLRVLPNGVPDDFFGAEAKDLSTRLTSDGTAKLVIASRLAADKVNQIPAMEILVQACLRHQNIRGVTIEVLGGGPMRSLYETQLGRLAEEANVNLRMLGWVDLATVRRHMETATFTVVGGVSGTQSVSLGTACLGAGIRCVAGVSTPDNMATVLGTNFGDHAVRDVTSSQIERDIAWMLDEDNYAQFQQVYVEKMRLERTHVSIAQQALDILNEVINREEL